MVKQQSKRKPPVPGRTKRVIEHRMGDTVKVVDGRGSHTYCLVIEDTGHLIHVRVSWTGIPHDVCRSRSAAERSGSHWWIEGKLTTSP